MQMSRLGKTMGMPNKMNNIKDLINDYNDDLLDLGIIFVDGEFNTELANKFRKQLFEVVRMGIKYVTIFINSYGGSLYDFMSMYGMIKSFKDLHITTVVNGYAMSAGAYLLCLGDKRMATPGSRIMFHELSSFSEGKLNDMEIDMAESKVLQKFLYKLTEKVIKKKDLDIISWLEKDQYLSINQAYNLGVLTKKNFEIDIEPTDIEDENDTQATTTIIGQTINTLF